MKTFWRIAVCLLLGWMPQIALAQSDPIALAATAADRLDAAQASLQSAKSARNRVDALTRTIKAYEGGLDALRQGLRQAALREAAIVGQLNATNSEVSQLLGVLISVQGAQGPIGLIHPAGPLGTARTGMMVADLTPAIQARAAALQTTLNELLLVRELQKTALGQLQLGLSGAQTARAELSKAMADRVDLPRRFSADPDAMQLLQESTETLQDFSTGLIRMDIGDEINDPVRSFNAAKGNLDLPATGTLLRRFNETDAAGIARPGLILATQPLAIVTTPWPATIRFAGPLLDYGNVMILEPESDTLLILAGLNVLYGEVGQVIEPGAPVGLMGGATPDADTFLIDATNGTGSALTETLYIELRQGTQPVDPGAWFASTEE